MQRVGYALSVALCAGLIWWWALMQRPSPSARLAEFEAVCLSATSQVGHYPMPVLAAGSVSSMRQVAKSRDVQASVETCPDDALRVHYKMTSSAQTMHYEAVLTAADAFGTTLWEYREDAPLTGATSLHQYNAGKFFSALIDDWQAIQHP